MEIWIIILSSLIGYLLGSISFSRIFIKILAPDQSINDIRLENGDSQEGAEVSMGYGANKASMILGTKWGITIGIFDMLKVIAPLIIFRFILFPSDPYFLYIAAFGLVGHNWPVYHRFKGGRGYSVMFGSLIVIDWLAAVLVPPLGLLLGFSLFASLSFAALIWPWLIIPWFLFSTFDINFVIYAIIINVVFLLGLIPEIKLYFKLRKEGRVKEYREKLLETSGYFRGMRRMEDFFKSLGIWRYFIGISTLIGIIAIFTILAIINI